MISLVVIAVITLILYPTISDLAPNNNEYLFKSAYKTIEMVTSDIMNTPNISAIPTDSSQNFCEAYCNKLNIIDGNCNNCTSFTTSNGMRWAFDVNANTGFILVDVNASNNDTAGSWKNGAQFNADPWGAAPNVDRGIFRPAAPNPDPITTDTFEFSITSEGKISILDTVGISHMQDPGD